MRKYYTRPCNFYYGKLAKYLINKKKALPLAGNFSIAFDQIEVFERKKGGLTKSKFYPLNEIQNIQKNIKNVINLDLKKIISKRKTNLKLNFNQPQIMGVLNITPDSFSDGGLFYDENKAFAQVKKMIKNGATIIDIGGESTRPGSKTIHAKEEWERIKKTIIKVKKKFKKIVLSLDTRKSYVMQKGIEFDINIIEMDTYIKNAANTGFPIFFLKSTLGIPLSANLDQLTKKLDLIAEKNNIGYKLEEK